MDVTMTDTTICVELTDIIGSEGHCLSDYKSCFDPYTWRPYAEQIEATDKRGR